jgi:hypothetical protein
MPAISKLPTEHADCHRGHLPTPTEVPPRIAAKGRLTFNGQLPTVNFQRSTSNGPRHCPGGSGATIIHVATVALPRPNLRPDHSTRRRRPVPELDAMRDAVERHGHPWSRRSSAVNSTAHGMDCDGTPISLDNPGAESLCAARPCLAAGRSRHLLGAAAIARRPGPRGPAVAATFGRWAIAGKLRALQGRVLPLRPIPSCPICVHLRDLRFPSRSPLFRFHIPSLILLSALRVPPFDVGRSMFPDLHRDPCHDPSRS